MVCVQSKRPLFPPDLPLTPDQQDVVDTFRVLATLPSDSLGAYIISMAQTASDVLIVVLLQRELGVQKLLRVVPLFETLDDLTNAPSTMAELFGNPWYKQLIANKQECMIGYSDSGKDAGRLAAAWGLYQAQEQLMELASEHGAAPLLEH
jgi:phosphoenolpyruvate carboxylase